ncbi:uncharacterized protein LOC132639680 isoform X1 [Lycium barbarum]|uniref:uncharacterized protein LOC132639680 isoform X1 n=1 Tax=Lycium barbarum TaxID=112863 RepID=UPI00293F2A42|nr:uncharacterized protein LOC132639680 isoform X1 [Lycium barbarum]
MAEIPRHVWEGLTAKELAQLAAQAVVEAERAATLAEEAEAYVEAAIYFAEVALKTLNTRRLRLRLHLQDLKLPVLGAALQYCTQHLSRFTLFICQHTGSNHHTFGYYFVGICQ